jgi:hypothetical protein
MKRPNYRLELLKAEKLLAEVHQRGAVRQEELRQIAEQQEQLRRLLLGLPTVAAENDALRRLGLSRATVTVDAVRLTYRRLAKQAHPDGGGSADAFRCLKADRDLALRMTKDGGR